MNPQLIVLLSTLLQTGLAISQTIAKAQAENREPTQEEIGTHEASIQQLNDQWAALLPKNPEA